MAAPSEAWVQPQSKQEAELFLFNSLVDSKVPFVPQNAAEVSWYACGPTVYDSAHMGHARNYVATDIVRRVLEAYFKLNVRFVMNVTDIDDKTITRARRNFLLTKYREENIDVTVVSGAVKAAVKKSIGKQKIKLEEAKNNHAKAAELAAHPDGGRGKARRAESLQVVVEQEALKLHQVEAVLTELESASNGTVTVDWLIERGGDAFAEDLDKRHAEAGYEQYKEDISNPSIFRAHAEKYEKEFFEDLQTLGCQQPTTITRVSDFVPKIIEYIETIFKNKMAYEMDGSVYFDIQAFSEANHTYGKLNSWAVGNVALAADGETQFENNQKRSNMDFVLWKAQKPGEPAWDSPWGPGRPGWHIECSAMASHEFGKQLDIHSGGEDLRFPHHCNELAQAEAFYHQCGCHQWVNYFLHMGHLSIDGLKMSKSLKNFITIRKALEVYSARQLRLMFLLQQWEKPMVYGEQSRNEMVAKEALLRNFLQHVEAALRSTSAQEAQLDEREDNDLRKSISDAEAAVRTSLRDNINTRAAMEAISTLIKECNKYMTKRETKPGSSLNAALLQKAVGDVQYVLSVFGLDFSMRSEDLAGSSEAVDLVARFRTTIRGLAKSRASSEDMMAACRSLQDEELVTALFGASAPASSSDAVRQDALGSLVLQFRDTILSLSESSATSADILEACDRLRDEQLVEVGIRLEDLPDGTTIWKRENVDVLRAELRSKKEAVAAARRVALERKLDKLKKELEKMQALQALPSLDEVFRDKYKFGEDGQPSHDKEGNQLDKKSHEKAKKEVEKQKKMRAPLEKKQKEDPGYFEKAHQEIQELRAQLDSL